VTGAAKNSMKTLHVTTLTLVIK